MAENNLYPHALNWSPPPSRTTNIQPGNIAQQATGMAASALASLTGIPQVSQVGNSLLDLSENYSPYNRYNVGNMQSMRPLPGVKYADFRSRKWTTGLGLLSNAPSVRLDGTSAATRRSLKAGIYAAAAATPVGAYSIFNLDGFGKTGFGWGDHDNPYALRNDFTARSHVATNINLARVAAQVFYDNIKQDSSAKKLADLILQNTPTFIPTKNPLEIVTPFRGDKVNVIDFGKRKLKDAYRWNPRIISSILSVGAVKANETQDFIKFFFTGPKLQAGNDNDRDDIIVFRATLGSLTDTFQPNWSEVQMIGRADPNYHYTGYSRDISIDFTVYATDRDELKPIYRKLNALAGYTAPTYGDNIALEAPWMRFTIGDLFYQQPAFISSLTYTMIDGDTTWEINIEDDPTNMQVPHKINVSMGLTLVADWLPQKGGRFYSLAKRFNKEGQPKIGNDNWLSDAIGQSPKTFDEIKKELEKVKGKFTEKAKGITKFKDKGKTKFKTKGKTKFRD